jgi:tetratricopeptide (TPR) repeat protein
MRAGRLTTLCLTPAVVAAVAAALFADVAPWMAAEWKVRRVVDAKTDPPRNAGAEVAVCAFYTGGMAKPDGSDIRVAVRGRTPTPHRVLQVGPGDLIRVAFAAVPGETRYYIYYGNPKAAPVEPVEICRGVLLESRRWSGGSVGGLQQVQEAWAKAPPLGADFVNHVSFGFNPFADSDSPSLNHYTGWFVAPAQGTYTLATSSDDDSWLLVEGKEVVSWPGGHGPVGDARHSKSVTLAAGVHRLDYWHVNHGGTMMAVAAWRPPGADRFEPIPAKVFLPVAEAALVEMDLAGERLVADFLPENAGESWWPDRYAIRMHFRNLSKAVSVQHGGRFDWDFGDGQTSTLTSPDHIYLSPGDYTVMLKCTRPADSATFRTRVRVDRNWWKQTQGAIDPIRRYADEAARYDFAKLDAAGLLAAVSLFDHEELDQAVAAAAAELVQRQGLDEAQVHQIGGALAEHLRKMGKGREAVLALRRLEDRLKAPSHKAEAAVLAAEVLLADLRRYDDADKEFQRALKAYAASGAETVIRRIHIGLGDIARHRGQGDAARKAYAAAAAIRVGSSAPNETAVRVGTLARYVEEYARERQWDWTFKFLDDWAWEFPTDRLQGHWSYLKASALVARGDRAAALLEATDLLAANPTSAYAVRLLLLAAECQVALGQPDKARLLLQTAAEDYPEDPDQPKARGRLQTLGGPIASEPKPKK